MHFGIVQLFHQSAFHRLLNTSAGFVSMVAPTFAKSHSNLILSFQLLTGWRSRIVHHFHQFTFHRLLEHSGMVVSDVAGVFVK
jgi:hypothetical protein